MLRWVRSWIGRWRRLRALWQANARELIARDEVEAFYMTQRLAFRSDAESDGAEMWHWHKVAVEVARPSPRPTMAVTVVAAIAREEREAGQRSGKA